MSQHELNKALLLISSLIKEDITYLKIKNENELKKLLYHPEHYIKDNAVINKMLMLNNMIEYIIVNAKKVK